MQTTFTEQEFKDYYQVLHLQPEADAAMVDQAYWHLARLYNAAIPEDPGARERLDELNEAYSVLRSPGLRHQYNEVRDAVLGKGARPVFVEDEKDDAEPPPLAVMAKQKPKPRKEKEGDAKEHGRPRLKFGVPKVRLSLPQFSRVPPWQNVAAAAIIVLLAGTALGAGVEPAFLAALVVLGLAFTLIPLLRSLPALPSFSAPAIHLPSVRAPRLPERHAHSSVDADSIRQSTAAMRDRWRGRTGGGAPPTGHDDPTL
jgi:hypothetical protein